MKKLLMVCGLMLLVMTTIGQAKKRPTTTLPIKKTNTDTTIKTTPTKATTTPVILKVDPKVVQKNQPVIGNINIQNTEKQKEINKAAEEIKNTPPKVTIIEANPLLGNVVGFVPKTYKLKITATDVQSIKTSNKRPMADWYKIKQKIAYVVGGKTMVPTDGFRRSNKFSPENELHGPGRSAGQGTQYYYLLQTTAFSSQIKVSTFDRLEKNIDASFIYTINESELNNPDAKMIIHTTLSEENYSTLRFDFEKDDTEVSIKDVLDVLTGKRPLYATQPYFDQDIAKGIKFDNFGGFKMFLTKVNYPGKIVLEGPIRKRTNSGKEKAAVWMRFELVE